jgi:hypothetical protein
MEAVTTPETSVNFYQTARRNIPENGSLEVLSSLQTNLIGVDNACHVFEIINSYHTLNKHSCILK